LDIADSDVVITKFQILITAKDARSIKNDVTRGSIAYANSINATLAIAERDPKRGRNLYPIAL